MYSIPLYKQSTFIYSTIDEHLDFFLFWAIMNKALVNILMQILWWIDVLIPLQYTRSGIAGLRGRIYTLLNCPRVSQSGRTNSHDHQQCIQFYPPQIYQHLVLLDFLILAILANM